MGRETLGTVHVASTEVMFLLDVTGPHQLLELKRLVRAAAWASVAPRRGYRKCIVGVSGVY